MWLKVGVYRCRFVKHILHGCRFVNDVRLKKEKEFSLRRSVLLTKGRGDPTEVSKTGRPLVPRASVWAFSNLKLTLEFCWICANTASSGVVNLHMSKTSNGCKTAPGRFCGCVPPCRCATVLQVELFYVRCVADRRVYLVDGYALSFACS